MSSRRKEKQKVPPAAVKKEKVADPVRSLAEKVRDHKEMESRWAVLQEARVEYFRGKDFAVLIENHPELASIVADIDDAGSSPSEEEIAELFLKRKLIVRCERMVKTVRPGRKKLSKWPARLLIHPVQSFTEDDGFFAWTFERRRPFWQTLLSFMVPVITVACCLFPVFPHWAKLTVLYSCLFFLGLIFGVLLIRWLVFLVIWILVGKRIWFFPNILAEEATLAELFRFMPDTGKDEEPPPKFTTRFVVCAFSAIVMWLSVRHAPDEKARARYRKKVGNIIDDVLTWSPAMLSGSKTAPSNSTIFVATPPENKTESKTKPVLNETEKIEQIFARAADLAADLEGEEDFNEDEVGMGNNGVDEWEGGTTVGGKGEREGERNVEAGLVADLEGKESSNDEVDTGNSVDDLACGTVDDYEGERRAERNLEEMELKDKEL